MVIDSRPGELSFREGPVFTNLLLADEINRTPPKTQSALLEAMEEGQVSVDGVSHAAARGRSWSPRPRTRSSTRAPTRCPRPSSTGSCSRWCCRSRSATAELEILRRHAAGFDPRDVAGAGRDRRWPAPRTSPPGRPPSRRVQVSPEVAGYIVDIARATRESPSLEPRRQPARRHRAAARGPGLGLADRPRLRHARRREGARARDARAPARAAARGRARGRRRRRRCSPPRSARCRSRADGARTDGRSPVASRCCSCWGWSRSCCGPALGTVWLWLLRGRAAGRWPTGCWRPRPARSRSSGAPVGAGAAGPPDRDDAAGRDNAGRAGCAALVRDAWQPTAGATDNRHRVRLGAGDRARAAHPAAARDAAATCAAVGRHRARAAARSGWPPASAPATCPGAVRSLPPFESRKHLPQPAGPAARPRRPGGGPGARPGHRVRLAARVRPRRRRPLDRLAGQRPQPQRRGPHLAARAGPAGGARARHLAHLGRPGRGRARGSTPRWTPPCCSPRSPPGPATGSTSSPATGGSAARLRSAGARDVAAQPAGHHGRPRARHRRGRLGRRWPGRCSRVRPAARARRAAHAAGALRRRGGAAAGAARAHPAPPRGPRLGAATPRSSGWPRPAARVDEVYDAAAAEQVAGPPAAHRRPAARARRRRGRRRRRAAAPRPGRPLPRR